MKLLANGVLHIIFPAMLGLAGLETLLSGRDLTEAFQDLEKTAEIVRHPVVAWTQRFVSLLLIVGSLQRIASHFIHHRPIPSPSLAIVFLLYWVTTTLLPGLFGAVPYVTHQFGYSLLLGLAALLSDAADRERILGASRNALFVYMLCGVVLIPVNPTMVLDTAYAQGLIPGLPRFAGLSSHPVAMGLLAQTAMMILIARPYQRRWLNWMAWLLGGTVLFIAQSKTAWICFLMAWAIMAMAKQMGGAMQRVGDPRQNTFGVLLCLGVIGAVVLALFSLLVVDIPGLVESFFSTSKGAQLMSMTGRDRIWIVAMEEWEKNPVFGYGPMLWDAPYRAAIGMPNATHAHNQFLDTMARAGTVGAVGLTLYAIVLLVLSVRTLRATAGLGAAMFLSLFLQSIGEIPMVLYGYGIDVFLHLLLIVVLASGIRRGEAAYARVTPAAPVPPRPVRAAGMARGAPRTARTAS